MNQSAAESTSGASAHAPLHYHAYDDDRTASAAASRQTPSRRNHRAPPRDRPTHQQQHRQAHHQQHAAATLNSSTTSNPSRTSATRVWSFDQQHQQKQQRLPSLVLDANSKSSTNRKKMQHQPQHQSPPLRSIQRPSTSTTATPSPLQSPPLLPVLVPQQPPQAEQLLPSSAVTFARQSARAGFLLKQGQNVVQFKRRFFCLQAATHLYYFLSANDTEPRGCLDLQGASVEAIGETKFAIRWGDRRERVVLEARTKEDAQEWMVALEQERLPYVKRELTKAKRKIGAYQCRVQELEQQLQVFKLVEQDRDGALIDAERWKSQFEKLDESMRRLTQQLRRRQADTTANNDDIVATGEKQTDTSLLDEAVLELEGIDIGSVPGTHFSALYNTVEQLQENLGLAVQEAVTAVEDVNLANERVAAVDQRMAKAEKHLCKIWEENCTLRKTLKQRKRERRVLVREIKNLREEAAAAAVTKPKGHDELDESDDEEKLIHELEEHVNSSIKLHETFLATNGQLQADLGGQQTLNLADTESGDDDLRHLIDSVTELATDEEHRPTLDPNVPLFEDRPKRPPVASLFDDDDESDDDSSVRSAVSVSSVGASEGPLPNPLLQLDYDHEPQLCAASSQSESSKSGSAPAHQATSKLSCPLADVVGSNIDGKQQSEMKEGHMYHLSFYSRRIGLQFQKVPPPPFKAKGLLTEAMTDDITHVPNSGGDKTAAELRRISAISSRAKRHGNDDESNTTCKVATPLDAVLVCGFDGFDDAGNNVRPKLGARLVAFDGVSVEVGKWTFDAVRKAIQARDRPLTLSFRNDYLTTEQRTILTKAVQNVPDKATPPPVSHTVEPLSRPVVNGMSHDCRSVLSQDDDLSVSASGSDGRYLRSLPQSFSGAKSVRSSSDIRSVSSGTFRSFSEAGSSASVLSAVAPLVSNLLNRQREPFTPEYLRRAPASVEDTPQHQDYTSELL